MNALANVIFQRPWRKWRNMRAVFFDYGVLMAWRILLMMLAGWIQREQTAVIDYLKEENRVLHQQLAPATGWETPQAERY